MHLASINTSKKNISGTVPARLPLVRAIDDFHKIADNLIRECETPKNGNAPSQINPKNKAPFPKGKTEFSKAPLFDSNQYFSSESINYPIQIGDDAGISFFACGLSLQNKQG